MSCLRTPSRRRRLAGAERGSRFLQGISNPQYVRVRATEHAPRGPCRVLERRHGLAEIVERGVVVFVERLRVDRFLVPVPSAGVGSAPSSAAMAWLTPGFLSSHG